MVRERTHERVVDGPGRCREKHGEQPARSVQRHRAVPSGERASSEEHEERGDPHARADQLAEKQSPEEHGENRVGMLKAVP